MSKKPGVSKLTYVTGDLFAAPPNSILIHACNTVGSWGAGIALAFREKYPKAFEVYKRHCETSTPDGLIGTCLVIRNEGLDSTAGISTSSYSQGHDIACLFTSRAYGKKKDAPEDILNATKSALTHLMLQNSDNKALHSCRINSGKFAIPWESTAAIFDELDMQVVVYDPK